jgi:hypothetical protein
LKSPEEEKIGIDKDQLIQREGIIVNRDIRGEELRRQVDSLMAIVSIN